ncbi:dual specificity protein phosphatase, catalytic domain-containing protein, putative [Eimeria necatrix]|uniref:protein-tyrosine-phosphatase n=1 Tax=Eimeria necatrix TaxID=51315 RepID=U6MS54_9EIME|nr:dual specificity protein phosphatase, catalytic domain-containing protein, putative [Eimeria necatrix]CDJ67017.1 dual specificity protein phosphatase, catalytic domain-containing protein, putative [Eimeria necatrix]
MEAHDNSCDLEPLDSVRFPWLFWGDKKVARNEKLLRRRKIVYIINCTPPCGEGGVPNFHERLTRGSRLAFRYLRVPIFDTQAETLQPYFQNVWEFMETCRTREDGNLLIHCSQGVSRSVAFICSYLIKYEDMSSDEALAFVRRRNPLARPNESFRAQLASLHECVKREPRYLNVQRRPAQGGWVPPTSSTRKRVVSYCLPSKQPQPKVARVIGPARPPVPSAAFPAADTGKGHLCLETNAKTVANSSFSSLGSSASPEDSAEGERAVSVEKETVTEEVQSTAAGRTCEDSSTEEDGTNSRTGTPRSLQDSTVPSPSDRSNCDCTPVPSADECHEQLGCKDTAFREARQGVDAFVSSAPRQPVQQLECANCTRLSDRELNARCPDVQEVAENGQERREPVPASRGTAGDQQGAAGQEEDACRKQESLLLNDADRSNVLSRAGEAPAWTLRPFAEASDNRQGVVSRGTARAAVSAL